MPDSDQKSFAATRSHEDARMAHDHAKVLIQSLLLVNGGAATAVLSFLGKSGGGGAPPSTLSFGVSACIFLYCMGLASALLASNSIQRAANGWSEYWKIIDKKDSSPEFVDAGSLRNLKAYYQFVRASGLFFFLASIFLSFFAF